MNVRRILVKSPNNAPAYLRPPDWINISAVADNEINLLVRDDIPAAFTISAGGTSFSVDWGDGNTTLGASGFITHTYSKGSGTACSEGYTTFKIRVYGASQQFNFFSVDNPAQISEGKGMSPLLWANFGAKNITTFERAFYYNGVGIYDVYCCYLREVTFSSLQACTSMSNCFCNCYALEKVNLPSSWGANTNLSYMFINCGGIKSLIIPSGWGSVTNTSNMFASSGICEITLPLSWGSITNANSMFVNCASLTNVSETTSWGSVATCSYMFSNCTALLNIKLPATNGAFGDMNYFFEKCYSLESVRMPTSWGSTTYVNYMFIDCRNLREILLPASWSSMADYGIVNMFQGAYRLTKVSMPASFAGSAITTTNYMFAWCQALNNITPITNWGNVNTTSYMFMGCYGLREITLPAAFSILVNMDYMFNSCWGLVTINNVQYLGSGTSLTNMSATFKGMTSVKSLTIGAKLSVLTMDGASSVRMAMTSLRLTNATSTFTGGTPAINIKYNKLDAAALNTLFGDLPTITSKTIDITGNPGAATCTRSIATSKGWTVTG